MRMESTCVAIRHAKESDAEALFDNYLGNEAVCFYLSRRAYQSKQQALQSIQHWREQYHIEDAQLLVLVIEEVASHTPIGCLVLIQKPEWSEIHFGISCQHQGKGYATQACEIGIQYLKQLGCRYIRTHPHIDNQASIRVLNKVGFKRQGTLTAHAIFPAISTEPQDCADMCLGI